MLPKNQRLRLAQDLTVTVRSGVRSGRRNVVLYARRRETEEFVGDRFGFIVSKAVGIAVKRNLAKRRMREIAHELRRVEGDVDFVVRALPGASELSWDELRSQINASFSAALRKLEDR